MPRTPTRHKRLLLAPLMSLTIALGLAVVPAVGAEVAPADTSVSVQLRSAATSPQAKDNQLGGIFFDTIGPDIPDDTFAITGRLTEDVGGTGLAGKKVVLLRNKRSETTYSVVGSATTDADGDFRFTAQHVVATAAYVVAYEPVDADAGAYNGSDSTDGGTVAPAIVFAWRDFNAAKRKVKGKLYFRGDINPGWGGHAVRLQRKTCGTCAWKTVAGKAATRTGAWSFPVAYPTKVGPVWTYRAVIGGTTDFPGLNSSVLLTTRRVYARGTDTVARLG